MAATARHAARQPCTTLCPAMHAEQHAAAAQRRDIQMSPSLTRSLVPSHKTGKHGAAACQTDSRQSEGGRGELGHSRLGCSVSLSLMKAEDGPGSQSEAGARRDGNTSHWGLNTNNIHECWVCEARAQPGHTTLSFNVLSLSLSL